MGNGDVSLDVDVCARLACMWEVTARKPGNVHRYRDFDDLTYLDFVLSAAAIAPILASAERRRVGQTILDCVRATRQTTQTNTNLGIILLLAPLAAVPDRCELRAGIENVLASLDGEDSRLTYEAIRLANPGGMGNAKEEDVSAAPTRPLRDIMQLAADRDMVARQHANGFEQVFDDGVPILLRSLERTSSLEGAIVLTQLHLMSRYPDTLIARKCGTAVAQSSADRAARVLAAGWPEREPGRLELDTFDAWLRAEGHSRNPGTTADILTSALFVALRSGELAPAMSHQWKCAAF
jgi:triphosphoribosyl-dephospho-CoA synthase